LLSITCPIIGFKSKRWLVQTERTFKSPPTCNPSRLRVVAVTPTYHASMSPPQL
jgi:hypothetical protein